MAKKKNGPKGGFAASTGSDRKPRPGSSGASPGGVRLGSRVVARTKQALRRRAEELLKTDAPFTPEAVSVEEARHVIHELQVHQIELDMQNEELRRSQEEIEVSRARYFDLYDLSPAGYVTLNEKGLIEEANLTFASLLQAARGTLIRQPITRFILPEDQTLYYFLRKKLLETGDPQTGDLRFVGPDGASIWVNIRATLQQNGQCWITLNDVTERKAIEEALQQAHEKLEERVLERTAELMATMSTLKENKARYRALVESTDDWVWETDRNGVYVYASPRITELLGYLPEQIVGRSPREFAHSINADESEFRVKKIIDEGRPFRGIQRICRHKEGHPVIVESSGVPFFDALGNPAGLRGIDRDITIRKNLEVQALRTRHLAAIGELAAGVAHEINNPINGIINYAQILDDAASASGSDPEIPRRIIKEGDRIAGIVKKLLYFSRQSIEKKKPVSLRTVLEDSLALFAPQLRKEGIHIEVDIPDNIPLIDGNPQQIQQVFINILANSRHALAAKPNGSGQEKRIEITARDMAVKGATMAEIGFYDNGIGIASDALTWIFDPFFSTKAAGEGTGLGLSISYGIVKDHRGDLIVESEYGEYTLAKIYLPVSNTA